MPTNGLYAVIIRYGAGFSQSLPVHDRTNYYCNHTGLLAGPDQEVVLAESASGTLRDVRAKTRERLFSLRIRIMRKVRTAAYFTLLNNLKRALYNGPVRVSVEVPYGTLGQTRMQYVTARVEGTPDETNGDIVCLMKAADPIFTVEGGEIIDSGNTGSPTGGQYSPVSLVAYEGTAVAEPALRFNMNEAGGVWRYYKEFYVTNPSSTALRNYPLCISLGNITASISEFRVVSNVIQDIRLETEFGTRKAIWVRDLSNAHTDVKVWTIIHSLEPGQSKKLRLLWGNQAAVIEEGDAALRPMFNMFTSTKAQWTHNDFFPLTSAGQSRNSTYQPYQNGARNIVTIDWADKRLGYIDGSNNVPGAGASVGVLGPSSGFGGALFNSPLPISSVAFDYVASTNYKCPLLMQADIDGATSYLKTVWGWPNLTVAADPEFNKNKQVYGYLTSAASGGATTVIVNTDARSGATLAVNDKIQITLDSGAIHKTSIASITGSGPYALTLNATLPSAAAAGSAFQQYYAASKSITFSGVYPRKIAFGLSGEHPELNSGNWWFGAAEVVTLTFLSTAVPTVGAAPGVDTAWGSLTKVDLFDLGATKVTLRGRFGNTTLGEYLTVNTTIGYLDALDVDCATRSVTHYERKTTITSGATLGSTSVVLASATWVTVGDYIHIRTNDKKFWRVRVLTKAGSTITFTPPLPDAANVYPAVYADGVPRMEAISWPDVNRYWVHIEPDGTAQEIGFFADSDSNFQNIDVVVIYPLRFL